MLIAAGAYPGFCSMKRLEVLISTSPGRDASPLEVTPGEGTLGISGWGCAAGILEPVAYTRASSAEFCYPILELTPHITPILD